MAAKLSTWPPSLLYVFSLLTLIGFVLYFQSLRLQKTIAPLVWNWLIIIFSFTGLSIGLYPGMIPTIGSAGLNVQEVAASRTTLQFMLVVMSVLLPIILTYTTYSYWIFRGKTTAGYDGK